MIRIERVALPSGLRAIACRDPDGYLVIMVSDALETKRQQAAVMEAFRASRRAGWRAGLPIPIGIAAIEWLRRIVSAVRARPVAWAAAATSAVAGVAVAGLVLTMPSGPAGPSASGGPAAGSTGLPRQPGGQSRVRAHRGGQVQPVAGIPPGSSSAPAGQAAPGRSSPVSGRTSPSPGRTSPGPGPAPSSPGPTSPAPAPSPSSSASPAPSPSPSPSPPAEGQPGSCVILLGIRVCVPLHISLSLGL
jgi:hypothetical protein